MECSINYLFVADSSIRVFFLEEKRWGVDKVDNECREQFRTIRESYNNKRLNAFSLLSTSHVSIPTKDDRSVQLSAHNNKNKRRKGSCFSSAARQLLIATVDCTVQ